MNTFFKEVCGKYYKPIGYYLLWIILHFVCQHMYTNMCVPIRLSWFMMSPITSINPMCQNLHWLLHYSIIIMKNMWIVLGAWITTNIIYTTDNIRKMMKIETQT